MILAFFLSTSLCTFCLYFALLACFLVIPSCATASSKQNLSKVVLFSLVLSLRLFPFSFSLLVNPAFLPSFSLHVSACFSCFASFAHTCLDISRFLSLCHGGFHF